MISFQVDDMSCEHCVGVITRAVREADPAATVQADLAAHRVSIESTMADRATLAGAIAEAGYTPVIVAG